MSHLWEVKHRYYCNEGNYYSNDSNLGPHYKRWADFIEEWGDADLDYNLVFRWDWQEDEDAPFNGDVNYRNGLLKVFIMGQRKGLYNWTETEVCRADEPAIREWLQPRLDHLVSLWSPLVTNTPADGER